MRVVEPGVAGGRLLARPGVPRRRRAARGPARSRSRARCGSPRRSAAGSARPSRRRRRRRPRWRGAACGGSSCPGSGPGRCSRSSASSSVVSRTWKRGSKEPTPIRSSSRGGEGPAVAGGDVAAVDPDLEVLAAAAGVDLEPARERRVGRLVAVAGGEHPAPAERVDDERRRERRRGRSRRRSPRRRSPCAARPFTLAVSKRRVAVVARAAGRARR